MKVLVGMPDPATRSGPIACEPPFVLALRALGVDVVETTYVYGDNLWRTPLTTRVRRVTRTALRLRAVSTADHFDVVHLNTSFDRRTVLRDTVTFNLLPRTRAPVFLKLHGSDHTMLTTGSRGLRALARFVIRRAAAIGVLSSAEREGFVSAGVPQEKVRVVRNALPASSHASLSRGAFLEQNALPPETPLLLFISRLIPTKGLLDTVRACAHLRDRGLRFVLCCLGEGPARADAEAEAARFGLGRSVRFFGYVPESEAAAFYRHCDVLVLPTHDNEGMPVVLLNALAAGLPIVTTRTRGALHYLSEPETCLWVEPHRPEQLADRLEELLRNDDLRHGIGQGAQRLALEFEPSTVAREYLKLYEELAAADWQASSPRAMAPRRPADSESRSSL